MSPVFLRLNLMYTKARMFRKLICIFYWCAWRTIWSRKALSLVCMQDYSVLPSSSLHLLGRTRRKLWGMCN